jgi:hypothetical protein
LHDGEPMTGIETMILGKPFIFNHHMEFSIETNNDPTNIILTIQKTYNQVLLNQYDKSTPSKYYLERNSNKVFEKNLIGWFKINCLKNINTIETNKILQVPSKYICKSEHFFSWDINITPGTYVLKFIGLSNGYGRLHIDTNSNLIILSSNYSKINKFETLSWLEFKVINESKITCGIKLFYPQENEIIEISNLSVQLV